MGKIQLKGDTVTEDIRLDRVPEFDERSRKFALQTVAKKHRSYTWRCLEQLDQGPDGACVGFGVAHELIARPSEVKNIDAKFAKEQVYWGAQKIDPWEGGSYPGAMPFYEGSSVLAGVKMAKTLGYIDEYRWAFGIEDLKYGVGHNGPAVIGINWYEGMYSPDEKNFIHVTGNLTGGHCVLVNSISLKHQRFTLHNSWGKNWGKNGEAYISFDDMDRLLKEYGEAVFFMKRHGKEI